MPRTNKSDEFIKHDRRREKSEVLAPVEPPTMNRDDVMQMLGAARYAEWIAGQSASHVMQFLMTVEDQKLYRTTGDKSFIEFLDRSGLKKKSTYYDHRKLLLKEGPEQYDLFEDLGVPARVRNLLESGDVVIDGNDAVIGGKERIALADGGVGVKKLVEQLVKDKIAAEKRADEALAESADHKFQRDHAIEHGKAVQERLNRITEAGPFEVALGSLMNAAVHFSHMVKMNLHPEVRKMRADGDLQAIAVQFNEIAEAYGVAGWQQKLQEIWQNENAAAAAGGKD